MIQFLLNDQLITLEQIDTNTTVLDYLRLHRQQTGTKEGCASGDCGACTVVLGELNEAQTGLQYRAINSCITLLGALQGKQLITVECLAGERLHPVQQTMVDCHGSQCGFCTPGFVMSLFAMWKQQPKPSHEHIDLALGGNLCRCTGYQPIIKAAQALGEYATDDTFSANAQTTRQALKALQPASHLALSYQQQQYFLPHTRAELAELCLHYPDARLVAGSTDLALEITQNLKELPCLIGVNQVQDMQQLDVLAEKIIIGAARPYSDCMEVIHTYYPAFAAMMQRLGSTQIRNQGTFGGNIGTASPIGDTLPVLLALNAEVELQKGEHIRLVNLNDYFTGYRKTVLEKGEFIAAVHIPRLQAQQVLMVDKVSKRFDDDISAVCAAWVLTLNNNVIECARSGYGGMAATPARALNAEQALIGKPLDHTTIQAAQQALAHDFKPMSDVRASSWYRMMVAQNLLERMSLSVHQPA
ncbi:xanthine dehydrogenase small subunit [Thiofilum flexile]|uniref:xanthine dehydrogenase small subunit n=1 Tax=Thiofilum flexile TaxID=125627 RepID=UPI00036BC917|nr:xanthine dehydrogenase small subunit [Thiofilum flexile]